MKSDRNEKMSLKQWITVRYDYLRSVVRSQMGSERRDPAITAGDVLHAVIMRLPPNYTRITRKTAYFRKALRNRLGDDAKKLQRRRKVEASGWPAVSDALGLDRALRPPRATILDRIEEVTTGLPGAGQKFAILIAVMEGYTLEAISLERGPGWSKRTLSRHMAEIRKRAREIGPPQPRQNPRP